MIHGVPIAAARGTSIPLEDRSMADRWADECNCDKQSFKRVQHGRVFTAAGFRGAARWGLSTTRPVICLKSPSFRVTSGLEYSSAAAAMIVSPSFIASKLTSSGIPAIENSRLGKIGVLVRVGRRAAAEKSQGSHGQDLMPRPWWNEDGVA